MDGRLEPATVLHYSRSLIATEPRDKIYGLLGILGAESVELDYTRSIAGVYTDCALHALSSGLHVLSLVSHHMEENEHFGLPSWVPNLNQAMKTPPMHYYRRDEDERVASNHSLPEIDIMLAREGTLNLAGVQCDTIQTYTEIVWMPEHDNADGNRSLNGHSTLHDLFAILWSELATASSSSKLSLARTLTGGRTLEWASSSGRLYSTEQFVENFMAFAHRFDPNDIMLEDIDGNMQGDVDAYHRYLSLVDLSLLRRRFFRTQRSWPGLGPECMGAGDVVVVFHGGTSPYVLRPVEGKEDYYHLLGECYVDILLDEGAYNMLEEGGAKEHIFYLV